MSHFTSNTYQMKRKNLTFTKKISRRLSKKSIPLTAYPDILKKEMFLKLDGLGQDYVIRLKSNRKP